MAVAEGLRVLTSRTQMAALRWLRSLPRGEAMERVCLLEGYGKRTMEKLVEQGFADEEWRNGSRWFVARY